MTFPRIVPHYPAPTYVKRYEDRHGRMRWYYRRDGRLYHLPGDPDQYPAAYQCAARCFELGIEPMTKAEIKARLRLFRDAAARIVERARKRSLDRKRTFEIDVPWVKERLVEQLFCCALTGLPFSPEAHGERRNPFAPSLDRIDSAGGYTPDNVRVVLLSVNCAISDWGMEHFAMICRSFVRRRASTDTMLAKRYTRLQSSSLKCGLSGYPQRPSKTSTNAYTEEAGR